MTDLISDLVGGRVVSFNDEFFAEAANLIKHSPPVWKEHEFTDRGKWMDGWETRRRRDEGHDWCVVELGVPGRIRKVEVDTAFFTGNYPEEFSLDVSPGRDIWVEAIPRTQLQGDAITSVDVDQEQRVVAVRLNIYPDGGVARLRVEGDPIPAMQLVCPDELTDLASVALGSRWLDASDFHYAPPSNLLAPTPSAGMWDGWETRRRRGGGHDWATFELGLQGEIEKVVADSSHFKGNCPGSVSLELSTDGEQWERVVAEAPVEPDSVNELVLDAPRVAKFVRLCLHPDGGLARLRVMGRVIPEAAGPARVNYLNSLFEQAAEGFFRSACSATRWVAGMLTARPFESVEAVLQAAESVFDSLSEEDWMEAFAGHPRIGARGDATANREQAGSAGHEGELAEVNAAYEEKFGFTYIVYASGKSGEEMIEIARQRLGNSREDEIREAAGEQRKITATRLMRMLCQETT